LTMTTAREALGKQLHELMKNVFAPDSPQKVTGLLDEFRVQAKPGTEVQAGATARETLGKAIAAIWKRAPKDIERSVDVLLDKYRMQLKKEGSAGPSEEEGPASAAVPRPSGAVVGAPAKPAGPAIRPAAVQAVRSVPAPKAVSPAGASSQVRLPVAAPVHAAPSARRVAAPLPPPRPGGAVPTQLAPRAAPQSVTPLFPGTPTGPSKRSECPKCKSRGVVLARSYTQEEFFSCIYCGWQAFKPFEEATADSPLAARLLSQRPGAAKRKAEDADAEGARKRSVIEEADEGARTRSVVLDEPDEPDAPARSTPAVRPDDGLVDTEAEQALDQIISPGEDEEVTDLDAGRDLED
jgi:hypothetical protein